jgi:hypothetical protein
MASEDAMIVRKAGTPAHPPSPVGGAPPVGAGLPAGASAGDASLQTEREGDAEPGSDPEASPPKITPTPQLRDILPSAWHNYLHLGDGHFNADGLRAQVEKLGITTSVRNGSAVDAEDAVLVVDAGRGDATFFVVPSFMKSPGAAPNWFSDESDGALGHRTKELRKLAEGRWLSNGFKVVEKGIVA